MDIKEFEKRTPPRAKRSRLEPFRAQILELKSKSYADWQIRDWLAANGLEVTRQAVQQFVKKHQHDIATVTPQRVEAAPLGHDQKPAAPEPDATEKTDHLTMKQRGEAVADQYMKPTSTNPVLKKLLKDKK